MTLGCVHFMYSSWDKGISLNKLIILGGRLVQSPKRIARAKHPKVSAVKEKIWKLARNFGTIFKVSRKGTLLENTLQNLNGVTDFGQGKF